MLRFIGIVPEAVRRARRPVVRRPPHGRVDRAAAARVDAGELVLDLPRPPPGRRPLPARAGVPARRRGARPQPGRRPGHEHRHRRRGEPGLEARRRRSQGARGPALLDTYEPERIAFARRLVRDDRPGVHGRHEPRRRSPALRARARRAAPCFRRSLAVRGRPPGMFRSSRRPSISYRGSPLSDGSRRRGPRRRPAAVGELTASRGQLRAAGVARLAGPRLRRRVTPGSRGVSARAVCRSTTFPGGPGWRGRGSRATRCTWCARTATWPWPTARARRLPSRPISTRAACD